MFSSKRKGSKERSKLRKKSQENVKSVMCPSVRSTSPQGSVVQAASSLPPPTPVTPPTLTFQRHPADRRRAGEQSVATTPTGPLLPVSSACKTSPLARPRTSPGRQTWARDGRHWRRQQGPLASSPELATVQSQYLLEEECVETPLTPPRRAYTKRDGLLLEPFESPPSSSSAQKSPSGSGFFECDTSSPPEWRRVCSGAVPHEFIFPRYEEVMRVKGLKPFTMSDIPPLPSRPVSSTSSGSQSTPQTVRHPIEDIPSPPRTYSRSASGTSATRLARDSVTENNSMDPKLSQDQTPPKKQQPPCRGLTDVRRPMMDRGPPSSFEKHDALVKKLCAGKDYVDIARGNRQLCELLKTKAIPDFSSWTRTPVEDLLRTEPAFLEAFSSPYESCGLVISCNDRKYNGQPYTNVLEIFRRIWDGMVDFGAASVNSSRRYHILTYIVGRHAPRVGLGYVGSVSDMLRSLYVQLLSSFRGELFLDNEYLDNVDINDSYSLIWAFMTLISAVATRGSNESNTRMAIVGRPPAAPGVDRRPKHRILILIDGINFLEEGTDKPRREYEEFFHELDELVIKLQEGHHMECFDGLREEWEAKGLKEKDEYPDQWQQFVRDCAVETTLLRDTLTLKYVFIHPQVSRWKPRKYGGSVILPVVDPIWI